MTDKKQRSAGSRILRERAMAVLRDTRAKIDPKFLEAMRQKFSSMIPAEGHEPAGEKAPPSEFAKTMTAVGGQNGQVYPSKVFAQDILPEAVESKTEAVDKEKIAQIVLQYMKHKEGQSKH